VTQIQTNFTAVASYGKKLTSTTHGREIRQMYSQVRLGGSIVIPPGTWYL